MQHTVDSLVRFRRCLTRALLVATSVLGAGPARSDSGVIEFSDTAPGPTDAQNKLAKAWSGRVAVLVNELTKMTDLLQVTAVVQSTVASIKPGAGAGSSSVADALMAFAAAADALFTQQASAGPKAPETFRGPVPGPQTLWTIHDDKFADFVAAGLGLQAVLQSDGATADAGALKQVADRSARVRDTLLSFFDALLAEHAILNRVLRYHPYNSFPQSPLPCDFVNHHSRLFVCVAEKATGTVGDGSWAAGTVNLAQYCIAEGGQTYAMADSPNLTLRMRKDAVGQAVGPQVEDARISAPLRSGELEVKCK